MLIVSLFASNPVMYVSAFLITIEIVFLIKLKKTKNKKYWNLFIGSNIAIFISTFIIYNVLSNNAVGLSDAISTVFVSGFSLISSIILFIIGIIRKYKIGNKSIKLNFLSFVAFIISMLLFISVLFVIPSISYNISTNKGEQIVINYLNKKYGEANYQILDVYKDYTNVGMWDKSFSGYSYKIKCDYMNKTFNVSIDLFNNVDEDYFIPTYYKEKYNFNNNREFEDYIVEKIQEKYEVEINWYDVLRIYENRILIDDYGRIPSIDEITDTLYEKLATK